MRKIVASYLVSSHKIDEIECNERLKDIFINGVRRGVIPREQSGIHFAKQCIEQDNISLKLCGRM